MEIFSVKNLSFHYPDKENEVLKNISFSVDGGEFITLCGPSGCGKSTLLRQLKPLLTPHGVKSGEVLFEGRDINSLTQREQCTDIGFILQSPDNQIVTDKVWHELAFGLEGLGLDNNTIRKRVAETSGFFGIENLFDKNVATLSGGQKQIINLASVMAMQPKVLILDEPASQLDPIAASQLLSFITKINRELGVTVIITEHRLDEILVQSSRVLVMDGGRIISYDTVQNTCNTLRKLKSGIFLSMPAPVRIWAAVDKSSTACPVTVADGRRWLENYSNNNSLLKLNREDTPKYSQNAAVELKNVWFRYEKDSPDVVKGLNLLVHKGEFAAILGGNGAGKSTVLSIISGANKPYRGKIDLIGDNEPDTERIKIAALPQNPQTLFVKKTVLEDLLEVFDSRKIEKAEIEKRINSVIALCKLEKLLYCHPFDLSGGEQQRAALAKILLLRPEILLLDEPTKGFDAEFKARFAEIINSLTTSGVTVIMASHDVEFCARYAHSCMLLFNGEIAAKGSAEDFFVSNCFYVTSANRMSRGIIDIAVTCKDVIYCCTGIEQDSGVIPLKTDLFEKREENSPNKAEIKEIKQKPSLPKKILGVLAGIMLILGIAVNLDYIDGFSSANLPLWLDYAFIGVPVVLLMISVGHKTKTPSYSADKSSRLSKRTAVTTVFALLLIPLTIFVGVAYLNDERYVFISLLIMFEAMIPFVIVFEGKKPKARELVIISVLCALAVSGRVIFNMLPQLNPVIAIIIITGISLGGESGFLVGAVTMLASNIMLGQGPWTPWQMFSAGIIGFLSGILSGKGLLGRNRASLCIYGFSVTLVLYGGIMNLFTAVWSNSALNPEMLLSFYVQGFPMDLIHSLSSVIFLYFAAEPMTEKLERVKIKYGLL